MVSGGSDPDHVRGVTGNSKNTIVGTREKAQSRQSGINALIAGRNLPTLNKDKSELNLSGQNDSKELKA